MQQIESDVRFWYTRGASKGLPNWLSGCALALIRSTEAVERDVRR